MRRLMMSFMKNTPVVSDSKYLTITALEDGCNVSFNRDYQYSYNQSSWNSGTSSTIITLNKGESVFLKGNISNPNSTQTARFTLKQSCTLSGNCMSMIYGDDADVNYSLPDRAFHSLFMDCVGVVSVSNGFLPATTLSTYCYYNMFRGCTHLVNAPALPATTLQNYCYGNMFRNCSSLKSSPELKALKLQYYCYYYMFNGCSSLSEITMLATDVSAGSCMGSWVNGVSSTGTFYKNKDATWNVSGNSGVPSGWNIITV